MPGITMGVGVMVMAFSGNATDAAGWLGVVVVLSAVLLAIRMDHRLGPAPGTVNISRSGSHTDDVFLLKRAGEAADRARAAIALLRDDDELAVAAAMLQAALWRMAETIKTAPPGAAAAEVKQRVSTMETVAAGVERKAVDRRRLGDIDALLADSARSAGTDVG